jgi:predicted DNA-binding transcriptional regulator AlpA
MALIKPFPKKAATLSAAKSTDVCEKRSFGMLPRKSQAWLSSATPVQAAVQAPVLKIETPKTVPLAATDEPGVVPKVEVREPERLSRVKPKGAPTSRPPRRAAVRNHIDLDLPGYLRLVDVLTVFPVSRAKWYAGVASGIYPPSFALGLRARGWRTSDIKALIEGKFVKQ